MKRHFPLPTLTRGPLRSNITALFLALFLVVLAVWIAFYIIISDRIYEDATRRAELATEQIMDQLAGELAALERVSFALTQDESVVAFTETRDLSAYYALADQIGARLENSRLDPAFVSKVMLYNAAGEVYRFSGRLSNTSCTRLYHLANRADLPEHLVAELENTKYIGYAAGIHSGGAQTGVLIMLIEEEKILELIAAAAPEASLLVSITAHGEQIATNATPEKESAAPAYMASRHVGLTPFEIVVSVDQAALSASTRYFTVAAVITALLFGLALLLFIRQLSRRWLAPMLRVMDSVDEMDLESPERQLPPVSSEEFDRLIEKINEMLTRLERKNRALQAGELRLKNAEIQKQKAIVFSLKKQINAHFTINTLATIQLLVEEENIPLAREMTHNLSALIRYAYDENEYIGAWDEFQIIQHYLTIMNARYAGKIDIRFNLDDRLMDVQIPRMLLQPIVENAIVHGFRSRMDGAVIEVDAALEADTILIRIRDNGRGMDEATLAALREQLTTEDEQAPEGIENIALCNIRRQLTSFYGTRGLMQVESQPGVGTTVTLRLPAAG